jgi:hypothetical protein
MVMCSYKILCCAYFIGSCIQNKEARLMSKAEITNLIHDRYVRGHTKTGWLDSYHTFSFGGFYDPNRMGFRSLRVINDDRVVPGAGFGAHSHRDIVWAIVQSFTQGMLKS